MYDNATYRSSSAARMIYNAGKRRYNLRLRSAFALLLATISTVQAAGTGFPWVSRQEAKANSNPEIVAVPAVVSDNAGRMMTDLRKDDFLILEDKVPQKIEFMISPQMPQAILLAFDASSSMKPYFAEIQDRAVAFVNSLNPQDQTGVLTFSDKNIRFADFTTDRTNTVNAIRTARLAGYTDLLKGISYICKKVRSASQERIVVLIISDAINSTSVMGFKAKTLSVVRASNFTVYGLCPKYHIEMVIPQDLPKQVAAAAEERIYEGQEYLRELALNSGGIVLDIPTLRDFGRAFDKISLEIKSQYTLGYFSTNTKNDGKFRKTEVKVNGHDYLVRSRSGYLRPKKSEHTTN